MPSQEFYSDIDLHKNEIKDGVIHRVDSFPSGAREGQVVYHNIFKSLCQCIDDTGDTTNFLAWKCSAMVIDPIGIRANCTAAEEVLDIVYIDSDGTVRSAKADNIATANVIGFIRSKETATDCTIVTRGLLSGFNGSGLIAGKQYFLSKNFVGGITDTPIIGVGNVLVHVGIGFDSSTLYIDIARSLIIRA